MSAARLRTVYLCLLLLILAGAPACAVVGTPTPAATGEAQGVLATQTAAAAAPSPAASPTLTRTPTRTATPPPSGSPTPLVAQGLASLAVATPRAGQRVSVAITAEELNEAFTLEDLAVQGATVGDPAITLEQDAIVARFPVTVTSPAMTLDVIVRGAPNVVDGALFVKVDSVGLGVGTGFLARLVAQPMVDSAIREYSGENGIPVPVGALQNLRITSATVSPGLLTIEGVAK